MRNTGSRTTSADPSRKAPEADTDTQTGERNKDSLVYRQDSVDGSLKKCATGTSFNSGYGSSRSGYFNRKIKNNIILVTDKNNYYH